MKRMIKNLTGFVVRADKDFLVLLQLISYYGSRACKVIVLKELM